MKSLTATVVTFLIFISLVAVTSSVPLSSSTPITGLELPVRVHQLKRESSYIRATKSFHVQTRRLRTKRVKIVRYRRVIRLFPQSSGRIGINVNPNRNPQQAKIKSLITTTTTTTTTTMVKNSSRSPVTHISVKDIQPQPQPEQNSKSIIPITNSVNASINEQLKNDTKSRSQRKSLDEEFPVIVHGMVEWPDRNGQQDEVTTASTPTVRIGQVLIKVTIIARNIAMTEEVARVTVVCLSQAANTDMDGSGLLNAQRFTTTLIQVSLYVVVWERESTRVARTIDEFVHHGGMMECIRRKSYRNSLSNGADVLMAKGSKVVRESDQDVQFVDTGDDDGVWLLLLIAMFSVFAVSFAGCRRWKQIVSLLDKVVSICCGGWLLKVWRMMTRMSRIKSFVQRV